MSATFRWPLSGRADDLSGIARLTRDAVSAREITGLSQFALRADPALIDRFPIEIPSEPNSVATSGAVDVLWLGPDEWLVVGNEADLVANVGEGAADGTVASGLASSLVDEHYGIVDVGANRAVVELAGAGRHHLLAARCGLDLDRRAWGDGSCAQSLLGRAQVLLHERNGTTRVFVRPSFGDYLVDLLVDAAMTSLRV